MRGGVAHDGGARFRPVDAEVSRGADDDHHRVGAHDEARDPLAHDRPPVPRLAPTARKGVVQPQLTPRDHSQVQAWLAQTDAGVQSP